MVLNSTLRQIHSSQIYRTNELFLSCGKIESNRKEINEKKKRKAFLHVNVTQTNNELHSTFTLINRNRTKCFNGSILTLKIDMAEKIRRRRREKMIIFYCSHKRIRKTNFSVMSNRYLRLLLPHAFCQRFMIKRISIPL